MDPIEKQLEELNKTTKMLLEVQGLQFTLEPFRYITRKLRSGEALSDTVSYYQLIAPGATFIVTFANPVGYVWIGIFQSIEVSQNGIFEFTGFVDDEILPKMYIPRMVSYTINWSETVPFGHVIKETTTIIYTNHDAANQWLSVSSMGIFLRKDVWEKDSALMDLAAERYLYETPPPSPLKP